MKKIILGIILVCLVIGGIEYYKAAKIKNEAENNEISQNVETEQGSKVNEDNWDVKPNDIESMKPDSIPAIDFKLEDLSGKEVSLSDYKGKKVFINFWASWCPPCKEEMPSIERLFKEHGKNVQILAINVGESKEKVEEFINEDKYTFPVLLDRNMNAAQDYAARYLPTSIMINEKGEVVDYKTGAMNYTQMKEFVGVK